MADALTYVVSHLGFVAAKWSIPTQRFQEKLSAQQVSSFMCKETPLSDAHRL